jgi:hypothetical protein
MPITATATVSTLSLLDASLDDMNDMPTWEVFPAGVYKVKPTVKQEKKKNDKGVEETIITVGAKLLEVRELNSPEDKAPEIGAETSTRYTWENEYGQGGLKNLLKPIAAATGVKSVAQLLEILNDADDVVLVMGKRIVKGSAGKSDKEYQQFNDLMVE